MPDTKKNIKKEALYLFATIGYEAAALSAIGERVGIKKASIYSHYQKKEDLFLEIYDEELSKRINHFSKKITLKDGELVEDRLFLIFKNYVEYYDQNRISAEFLVRFTLFPPKDIKETVFRNREIKDKRSNFFELLSSLFIQGQKDKIIREIEVKDLITSYYWLCSLCIVKMSVFGKKYDLSEIQKEWDLYFTGIKNT